MALRAASTLLIMKAALAGGMDVSLIPLMRMIQAAPPALMLSDHSRLSGQ